MCKALPFPRREKAHFFLLVPSASWKKPGRPEGGLTGSKSWDVGTGHGQIMYGVVGGLMHVAHPPRTPPQFWIWQFLPVQYRGQS